MIYGAVKSMKDWFYFRDKNKIHKCEILESHIKYGPDIDGLRCLAILAVVAYHYFPNISPEDMPG